MSLTNVWCRDSQSGEWVRTDADETDKRYAYTVSAYLRLFRCYSCYQYVTFIKKPSNGCSHFKHSTAYKDKECEDRSTNITRSSNRTIYNITAPMKLYIDDKRISLSIGFLPVGEADLRKAINNNITVYINSKNETPRKFKVDNTRFMPHATCWLDLPLGWADSYSVSIQPKGAYPWVWSVLPEPIPAQGALFDAISGRRLPTRGDAVVGREYYYMRRRQNYIPYYSFEDVEINEVNTNSSMWTVFSVKAINYTESASRFFFDKLKIRLTNNPANIQALWPPLIEDEDMLCTNMNRIMVLTQGEADLETYPSDGRFVCNSRVVRDKQKLVMLKNTGALQMVCAERYSQRQKCLYIRPLDTPAKTAEYPLSLSDDDGKDIDVEVLSGVPIRGILRIISDVDGFVDVVDEGGFYYRKHFKAREEIRLIDLRKHMRLTIRQGLDIVRRIEIASDQTKPTQMIDIPAWSGQIVSFPSRYAGVLTKLESNSDLYNRVFIALRKRTIPKDGIKAIRKWMEGQG